MEKQHTAHDALIDVTDEYARHAEEIKRLLDAGPIAVHGPFPFDEIGVQRLETAIDLCWRPDILKWNRKTFEITKVRRPRSPAAAEFVLYALGVWYGEAIRRGAEQGLRWKKAADERPYLYTPDGVGINVIARPHRYCCDPEFHLLGFFAFVQRSR